MATERKFKKITIEGNKLNLSNMKQIYDNILVLLEKRHWPKFLVLFLFPLSVFGVFWFGGMDAFVRNPILALLFYGFNLFEIYVPFILQANLEVEAKVVAMTYLAAVLFFGFYLVFLKYFKKEKEFTFIKFLSMKEFRYKKELKKNPKIMLFGILFFFWTLGQLVTILIDAYLLLHFIISLF